MNLGRIYAVVLCGGKGRRLRKIIKNKPKTMALVHHRPFLDFVIDYIISFGIKNIVLCSGYMSEVIEKYYSHFSSSIFPPSVNIYISKEHKPLGTAGAIKNAKHLINSNNFFVLNGDSLCKVDLKKLLEFHIIKKSFITITLTKLKDSYDYGSVVIERSGKITNFSEKNCNIKSKLVNAGVYVFNKKIFDLIPRNKSYSLEYDLFPKLKNCYGFVTKKKLIDIGTPERYKKAQKIIKI